MSAVTHEKAAAVLDLVFPALDGAVTSISRRLDAEGGDMDMVATALMSWALSRHAAIYAVAAHGDTRIRDGMVGIIKEMVDKQYSVEFDDAAARQAEGGVRNATVQ